MRRLARCYAQLRAITRNYAQLGAQFRQDVVADVRAVTSRYAQFRQLGAQHAKMCAQLGAQLRLDGRAV